MNKTQAERLLTLAYYMKTEVKREHYNQDIAIVVPAKIKPEVALMHDNFCESQGCSIGFLPIIFPKKFMYKLEKNYIDIENWEIVTRDNKVITHSWSSDSAHTEVLKDFFGLNSDEVYEIFGPEENSEEDSKKRTPKQQAKIIEKIVEKNGYTYA